MLSALLMTMLLAGNPQEMMIPEGTVLPVVLNETISTAKLQDNDPILFSLADDIRAGGHRGPILIPRGSNVVGRAVKSERAGHIWGRADINIRVQEIITPTGEVYDGLSTKVVDVAKAKGEKAQVVANGEIQGPTHRKRDAFFLLFPPTTLFQLLATPERGPDVVIPVETRLYVKLMAPIYVEPTVATEMSQMMPQPVQSMQPQLQSQMQVQPMAVPQAVVLRMSPRSLELLLTPVALYPDSVLRDLFVACTHPLEIVQASQWLQQNRNVNGTFWGGYGQNWDSSIQSLTAYPDLMQRLSSNIDWATSLGNAYRIQQQDVFATLQRLRGEVNASRRTVQSGVPVLAWRP